MIIPDGDRALKRLWYAKKKMAIIKEHDLPANGTIYQGFTMKVWQQGDLEGGFIKSPMGMVVTCCTEDGFISSVADFWLGGINHRPLMNCLITNPPGQAVNIGALVNGDVSELYDIQPFKVVPSRTDQVYSYNLTYPGTKYQDMWPHPKSIPYLGEVFWLGMTGLHWYDPDQNGSWNEFKYIAEIMLNFYCSDGSQSKRTSCFMEVGELANTMPARIYMGLPQEKVIEIEQNEYGENIEVEKTYARFGHMHTIDYDQNDSGYSYIGGWFSANHEKISYSQWTVATIVQGVPDATLRNLMATKALPIGNYQFSLGDDQPVEMLHAMDAYKHIGIPITDFVSFYGSNPSLKPYNLTVYKWKEDGTIYTFDSSEFLTLLDSLADGVIDRGGGSIDYERAYYMLIQLFPYPNNNFMAPFDSAMFHSHNGNVYTWTRHYGAVQFSNSGLAAYTLYLPSVVTANLGVRPDIAYAGNERYTLVATKPGKLTTHTPGSAADIADWVGVKGVFVGTPFADNSWIQLPDPESGFRLRYARPVRVEVNNILGHPDIGTPTRAMFIGVAEQYEPAGSLPSYPFRACFIDYRYSFDSLAWEGSWSILSPVPVDNIDWLTQFDMSLFGDGSMVNDLKEHPDPPDIFPAMPVQPYDNYTAVGDLP